MNNSGLYILYEGFLCEMLSELGDSIIIEYNNKFILLPKKDYTAYTLKDLTEVEEFQRIENKL